MKYLVTGGAGFIGSNLVDQLVKDGHEVTVIDNESSQSNEKFYWRTDTKNYKLDICDYESTKKLYDNIDCVFHLAAEARIQPSITNPINVCKSNFVGTCTVLQCCKEAGVKRLIYSSTSSAYGSKTDVALKENMVPNCLTPYSVSKVGGEELCKMYSSLFGLETIIFRYFNVYGERQPLKGQYAPVIGIFLRQAAANEPMTIIGDGFQRRDFTNVKDVVAANILAANFKAPHYIVTNEIIYNIWTWGQVYNVGTGVNYSINEIADMIGTNKINIAPRLGESRSTLADISKIKHHLNWKPKISLKNWLYAQLNKTGDLNYA